MRIAYLFQNIGTKYTVSRAEQIHVLYTLRELQKLGHNAKLVAPYGRKIIYSENLHAITSDELTEDDFARLALSDTVVFKTFESAVRRLQTELHLPYLALFESFRTYEALTSHPNECELIHERFNLPAFGGVFAKKKLAVPYILEMNADLIDQRAQRGDPERGMRKVISTWNTRLCFNHADKILCTTSVLANRLKNHWNVPIEKIDVLPCAADVPIFSKDYPVAAIRESLGLSSEPVMVWVGGYHLWQDFNLILEGFAKLVKSYPSIQLIMVGDGPMRADFERGVIERHLGNSIRNLGYVPHERIPELIAIADIAINPHPAIIAGHSGAALKLFEYMAAGKAIITTDIPQVTEILTDGDSAILIPPGDVEGFVNATIHLLENPGERRRLGENARRLAVERHSWEAYTRQLVGVYQEVLHKIQ